MVELQTALRKDSDVALCCVSYLFLTTTLNNLHIVDADGESCQGFFKKPDDFQKLKELLCIIIRYWSNSAAVEFLLVSGGDKVRTNGINRVVA